jgi:tetratricopeptide (TPR) repeat protein
MNKYFITGLLSLCLFVSCRPSLQPVTHAEDYSPYMVHSQMSLHSLKLINEDMDFWKQRLQHGPAEDPVSRVKLAGLYASRFKIAGDINDIHTSDSLYLLANPLIKIGSSSVYRALAANCITQHKFRQAKLYIDTALVMGDGKYTSLLMLCDVSIELGDLGMAKKALSQIEEKNDFDYLIREAKLLDHQGNHAKGIEKLEKAVKQVDASNNDRLFCWATTNLGDMYGHANRFSDAYHSYLQVLKKSPEDLYALKGIAWLAFSHDRNIKEAKRILNYLSRVHPVPDYQLMLAKIAEYEQNVAEKDVRLKKFVNEVSDARYGDMYNKYVFYLMSDEMKDASKALTLAEREVSNRPTPQSFDLLAWAKFQAGDRKDALRIARNFVENKNFEPDAYYHLGIIYASAGDPLKSKKYLRVAESSSFELGPSLSDQIKLALKNL